MPQAELFAQVPKGDMMHTASGRIAGWQLRLAEALKIHRVLAQRGDTKNTVRLVEQQTVGVTVSS